MEEKKDVIVIGAGPIGLNCAIEAKKANLDVLVIEKGVLVNSIYNFPTNMTFFSTSKLLEIGDVPFISHNDKPTRSEALEYFRRVKDSWGLDVTTFTEVIRLDKNPEGDGYRVVTSRGTYSTNAVIVSTGFYDTPRLLNIPGEDLPKVKHFYDDPHPYIGKKIAIIGAANSACDVALETYQKGAEVTMVIRSDSIYKGVKYWIRPNIENRIKEGSIKAYFESEVTEIKSNSICVRTPDEELELPNDFVLAMTGYKPDYGLFQRLGIQITDDTQKAPVHDPETLETNLENVFVAGVINSGLQTSTLFIENTRIHAKMICDTLKKQLC